MNPLTSPLLTDLYQLTMLQGYIDHGMHEKAVFEFYVRKLPDKRGFLIAAGLDTLLSFLEEIRFSKQELQYLADSGRFSESLIEYLSGFRFNGDVFAMPEGTPFFDNEPVIRIVAPLPIAQLIESRLINILHFEILVASKAARCVLAAAGCARLVDFGLRRAHGAEAGLLAARAAYIMGFAGTATVLADPLFGIPIFGTMAHSYIQAHENELDAFLRFARANPGNTTLLIDTYEPCEGARTAARAARMLAAEGIKVQAVRIDSGDLPTLSRDVRRILDDAGFKDIRIFVSGNLDEYAIHDLFQNAAPIDGLGVGTKLVTSEDAPYLECAYKLMEYDGKPRFKKSLGKATIPGRKQVIRRFARSRMIGDAVVLEGEDVAGVPLLVPVMECGRRTVVRRKLKEIASYARTQLESLPPHFRSLETLPPYPVDISDALIRLGREAGLIDADSFQR
jgi:nicotinate phosphoribosyltransferase